MMFITNNILHKITKYKAEKINYNLNLIYKFFYCITSIFLCNNIINQFNFIYADNSIVPIYFIYFLSLLLFIFLIGYTHFVVRLLIFIIKSYCLLNIDAVYNIELKFAISLSFWNVFICFDSKKETIKWPIFFCCFAFLMNFCTGGGLTKFFDNIWFAGYGLYYSLNVGWCNSNFSKLISSNETLVVSLNYIVIFLETFSILFFLSKKLMIVSFFTIFSFSLFTLFILRIDLIGQYSICSCILFYPLFFNKNNFLSEFLIKFNNLIFHSPLKSKNLFSNKYDFSNSLFSYSLIIFFLLFSSSYSLFANIQRECRHLNTLISPFEEIKEKLKLKYAQEFVGIRYDRLFTRIHFEKLVGYRAIVTHQDGSLTQPIRIFNDDLSAAKDTSNVFSSRFYAAFMYRCNIFQSMIQLPSIGLENINPQVYNFLRHVYDKSSLHDSPVSHITLSISPILQPPSYNKNFSYDNMWFDVLTFFPKSNSFEHIRNDNYRLEYPTQEALIGNGFNIKDILSLR
jgi:hypothetical protein